MSLDAAKRRFQSFFGRKPGRDEVGDIDLGSDTVLVVGELDGVMYKAIGEEKSSLHRFNKNDRPLLCVSSDGRQLYAIKGSYRFTDRGFVG